MQAEKKAPIFFNAVIDESFLSEWKERDSCSYFLKGRKACLKKNWKAAVGEICLFFQYEITVCLKIERLFAKLFFLSLPRMFMHSGFFDRQTNMERGVK